MKWKQLNPLFRFSTMMLVFSSCYCYGDVNMNNGRLCSKSDNSTIESDFQFNVKNLLDSVAQNGPLLNGFYTGTIGEGSSQIYGLMQCRGDLSTNNCAVCIKNSTEFALSECPQSKDVAVWFTWCFLRFSTENFIAVLSQTAVAVTNETNYDDPSVVSNGLSLVSGLASSAPNEPLMFQTNFLDAGEKGKRYAMAQCTRDIGRSDCNQCLNSQLDTFRTTIGSKKDWEIYGLSCFMWYHDHQFYFNYNISTSAGTRWTVPEGGITSFIPIAVLMLLIIL